MSAVQSDREKAQQQCNEWRHEWVEEYYGYRCAHCGEFYPYGCAPWEVDEDGEPIQLANMEDEE